MILKPIFSKSPNKKGPRISPKTFLFCFQFYLMLTLPKADFISKSKSDSSGLVETW